MRHVDLSVALAKEGVAVTHIYAGARKIDGNPYQPLPDGVRSRFQAEVDHVYNLFVAAVAEHRRIGTEAIRATEAGVFRADEARSLGLIDRIENPDQLLARLSADRNAGKARLSITTHRTPTMSDPTPAGETAILTAADVSNAKEAGRQAGIAEGRTQERARIGAIFDLPDTVGREALARKLALTTDLTPEAIAPILAAAPKAEPPALAAGTDFAAHMAKLGNPTVGPDPTPVDASVEDAALWGQAFSRHRFGKAAH